MNIRLYCLNYVTHKYQYSIVNNARKKISKENKRDSFIKSKNLSVDVMEYSAKNRSYISQDLLLKINHDTTSWKDRDNIYECAGVQFSASQIPPVDTYGLKEVKACSNIIDFGKNTYFKYVSLDGKEHALICKEKGISTLLSERLRGVPYDAIAERYVDFWSYMTSKDVVFYGQLFSDNEVRSYLNEAGIKQGFFTIKMGNREATQYYSGTMTEGIVQSKDRYDEKYRNITSSGYLFMNYEPGSIFTIDGKEYELSEEHTLDIPYGADIYDIGYPSNYRCGVKIS